MKTTQSMQSRVFLILGMTMVLNSCGLLEEKVAEVATQELDLVSELMVGIDEGLFRSMVRETPLTVNEESAEGAACVKAYGKCVSGAMSLLYKKCILGDLVLDGTVDFKYFGDSNCHIDTNDEYLVRIPKYSFAQEEGTKVTFDVPNTATNGITIKKTSSEAYDVFASGLRRRSFAVTGTEKTSESESSEATSKLKTSISLAIAESTPLKIVGESRSGRKIVGGTIVITDSIAETSTELTPNYMRWEDGCNCPVSGQWQGTYNDPNNVAEAEQNYRVKIELTGCGQADFTRTNETTFVETRVEVKLSKCVSL